MSRHKLTLRSLATHKVVDPTPETDEDGGVVTYPTAAEASLAATAFECPAGQVVVPEQVDGGGR